MYAAHVGIAASRQRPRRPDLSRAARRIPRISLQENRGSSIGRASVGATHRPAGWNGRLRGGAQLHRLVWEGAANATHRPWICTPKKWAPPHLSGRGFAKQYRGGFVAYSTPTYPAISYHILPYPTISYPTLPYPTPSYRVLPYPTLSYSFLPFPTLSYPILSYPILPYPILAYPSLSKPILAYPIP